MAAEMDNMAPPAQSERRLSWKVFGVLMLAGLVGSVSIMPYALALNPHALDNVRIPIWAALTASVVQTMILVAIAVAIGLWLGPAIGLGAPRLRQWLSGDRAGAWAALKPSIVPAVAAGILGSVLIVALDVTVFKGSVQSIGDTAAIPVPSYWQGLLASFYGGINEELLLRLGVMTLIARVGAVLLRQHPVSPAVYWFAILVSAIGFGLGHLPAASQVMALTAFSVTRTIVLNGLLGVIFGWFYWKRGLASAMVSHFSGDLILHVLLPLLGG
jgi:Type II CAAX prenyl endopeptidase Rce1-like